MNRFGKPAIAPRFFELLLTIVTLVGLYNLYRVFRIDGYLPAPFVFDVTDTFMDWFNTAYWAHNKGAYSVWNTVYAPLSFVVTGILGDPSCYANGPKDARDCDVVGIVAILLIYVASIAITAISLYRTDRSTAVYRTICLGIGGPMLFALERGNVIMLGYIAFVLLYGGFVRSKTGVAAVAATMINMKSYLLFPVLGYAVKREWRTLELCGLATIAIYLVTMVLIDAGTPAELAHNLGVWFNARAGTVWDEVLYSTTYKPYLLLDERQYPVRDFVEQRTIDIAKFVITYQVIASRLVAILCVVGAWFYPKAVAMHRIAFFVLMQSFMNQNPGGYAIAFVVFLVFQERWKNLATGLAITSCYVVSIPTDLTLSVIYTIPREVWLSQRLVESAYALSWGGLLRPGLLVIMLWSMAVDTLIDLYRAIKTGRPIPGLALRSGPVRMAA